MPIDWFSSSNETFHNAGRSERPAEAAARRCPRCLSPLEANRLEWRCHDACHHRTGQFDFRISETGIMHLVSTPEEQTYPCPRTDQCSLKLLTPYPKDCPHAYETPLGLPQTQVRHVALLSVDGRPSMPSQAFGILLFALKEACVGGTNLVLSSSNIEASQIWGSRRPGRLPPKPPGDPICLTLGGDPATDWPRHIYLHPAYLCADGNVVEDRVVRPDAPSPRAHPAAAAEERCPHLSTLRNFSLIRRCDDAILCIRARDAIDPDWRRRTEENLAQLLKGADAYNGPRGRLWIFLMHSGELFDVLGQETPGQKWLQTAPEAKRDEVIGKYVMEVCRLDQLPYPFLQSFREIRSVMAPVDVKDVVDTAGIKSLTDALISWGAAT